MVGPALTAIATCQRRGADNGPRMISGTPCPRVSRAERCTSRSQGYPLQAARSWPRSPDAVVGSVRRFTGRSRRAAAAEAFLTGPYPRSTCGFATIRPSGKAQRSPRPPHPCRRPRQLVLDGSAGGSRCGRAFERPRRAHPAAARVDQLGQVHRLASAAVELLDLGAAAEAVGEDDRVLVGVAHAGQQHLFGAVAADLEVAGLEPEVAREAAAAGAAAPSRVRTRARRAGGNAPGRAPAVPSGADAIRRCARAAARRG